MTNYEYCCASCGTESIVKKPASKSVCATVEGRGGDGSVWLTGHTTSYGGGGGGGGETDKLPANMHVISNYRCD